MSEIATETDRELKDLLKRSADRRRQVWKAFAERKLAIYKSAREEAA